MIEVRAAEPAGTFARRLAERAARLAEARATAGLLVRRGAGERRWRTARLLWPLFGGN